MDDCKIFLPKFKPKQQLIWDSDATEILIAGDTRSGKSFLVRKAYILLCATIPGLISDILRLNYEDVLKNYMVGETSFPALLDQWERSSLCKITESQIEFWNGSTITLGHCADERALRKHQGNPSHLRTIDESGQFEESSLRGLGGWLAITEEFRSKLPEKYRNAFPKLWFLTNFIGPGMSYFRRGFLEALQPFEIKTVGQHRRQFVPMYLSDNDSEDALKVIARIKEAFPDPAVQSALLECNWKAAIGEFFPEWNEDRHMVTDFVPPQWWFRYRAYDSGQADPMCVLFIAVSDGEPFEDENQKKRWFPRGAKIFYNEWYECNLEQPSKGVHMANEDVAKGILARSEYDHRDVPTLTDSKPFQATGGETPAMQFQKAGVILTMVKMGPGSRVSGWNLMRSDLIGIHYGNEYDKNGNPVKIPMFYVCECCVYLRKYIPLLPRHPSESKREDAIETGESSHACDTARYACVALTDGVIRDRKVPTIERINRELQAQKPTLKNLAPGLKAFR